jgi:hypothetical protein
MEELLCLRERIMLETLTLSLMWDEGKGLYDMLMDSATLAFS